jgi:hypothetical protein
MTVNNSLIIFATTLIFLPFFNKTYLFLFEKNAQTGLLINYGKTKYSVSYKHYKEEFKWFSEKYKIRRLGIFQIIFHGLIFICFLLALKL